MNRLTPYLAAVGLGLFASSALALPSLLITHNNTNLESNAYIAGIVPSPHPSKAWSTNRVSWLLVQMACYNKSTNDLCPATIKMATNTNNPLTVGEVFLNLKTGEITPNKISGNGYTFTVNGLAESTLTEE